jgi:hypothetical protein
VVIHIAEDERPCRASLHASGKKSSIKAVDAPVALVDYFFNRMNEPDIVRTGCHAIATPDAKMRINHHDPILTLIGSLYRADCHTNGLIAIIAKAWDKGFSHKRCFAFFNLLHPRTPHAKRNFIFILADNLARLTPNATPEVHYHCVSFLMNSH